MPDTRKVRTTIQPWIELEVTPQEYTELRVQGLLIEEPEPEATEPGRRAVQKKGE